MISKRRTWVLILAAALMGSSTAVAGNFTLGRAVPADSLVYINGVKNPASEFIYKHWDVVFAEIKKAGIADEIRQLIVGNIHLEEERTEFLGHWDDLSKLIDGVGWGDLIDEEVCFYVRVAGLPEMGMLARPNPATLQNNVDALVNMMTQIAALSEEVNVTTSELMGAKTWSIGGGGSPVGLHLFHLKETIGIMISPSGVAEAVKMLQGQGGPAIVNSDRFKKAMKGLPKPEDAVTFVDVSAILGLLTSYLPAPAPGEKVDEKLEVVRKLMNHFDVFDYVAATDRTEGLQTFNHSVGRLKAGAAEKPLIKMMTRQGYMKDFGSSIPDTSTGYMVWSGIDFEFIYDEVLDFVKKNVPDGAEAIAEWDQDQAREGFNLKNDLLGWIDGQIITVNMPPAIQTGFSSADFVLMVKIKDAEKASTSVSSFMDKLNSQLDQTLMMAPAADVNASGFKSVTHPMIAMMFKLTYGVSGDWLVLANSSAAINKCLATQKGEGKSFLESDRYKKEGVFGQKQVVSSSFSDLRNTGQELAMALGMLPMFSAMIPPSPETQAIRACFGIAGKLAPALAKIDFLVSQAGESTWDGQGWVSVLKTTYRPYKERPAAPEPASKPKSSIDGL